MMRRRRPNNERERADGFTLFTLSEVGGRVSTIVGDNVLSVARPERVTFSYCHLVRFSETAVPLFPWASFHAP